MNDPLSIYLADHLAGSVHATQLLTNLRDEHDDDALRQFAAVLLVEIEADRQVLQALAQRVGSGASAVKEFAAWVGEKLSRLKLRDPAENALGTFEALEFLALGIQGKRALWTALALVSPVEPRLQGLDYEQLRERAETQHASVEDRRLNAARAALTAAAL